MSFFCSDIWILASLQAPYKLVELFLLHRCTLMAVVSRSRHYDECQLEEWGAPTKGSVVVLLLRVGGIVDIHPEENGMVRYREVGEAKQMG
jgi:hypothetical protein